MLINPTWHKLSPGVHSRIHCPQQSGRTSAPRLWQAVCHRSQRPPIHQTARTAREHSGGLSSRLMRFITTGFIHKKYGKKRDDHLKVPESGRCLHSHPERTVRVGRPGAGACRSGWETRWPPRASSRLQTEGHAWWTLSPLVRSVPTLLKRRIWGSPRAPWHISVLVAPPTINWGSSVNSCRQIRRTTQHILWSTRFYPF